MSPRIPYRGCQNRSRSLAEKGAEVEAIRVSLARENAKVKRLSAEVQSVEMRGNETLTRAVESHKEEAESLRARLVLPFSSITRLVPSVLNIVGFRRCEHVGRSVQLHELHLPRAAIAASCNLSHKSTLLATRQPRTIAVIATRER